MSNASSSKPGKSGIPESDVELSFFMGEKCSVEGATLDVDGAARIDGQFSGKLRALHLIVGEQGRVAGDISSETADIMGSVEDTLILSGKLIIREAGRIEGTITYGSLEAHEGAQLIGQINTQGRAKRTEGVSSLSNLQVAIAQAASQPEPESDREAEHEDPKTDKSDGPNS
ncbi:polymer-forming cytoskeletal protein [Hyphomonadaceae bacterium BL14]|nr:polymer-forming cytoskeletal protein [Hyphomonadaceae bacterium BL14]